MSNSVRTAEKGSADSKYYQYEVQTHSEPSRIRNSESLLLESPSWNVDIVKDYSMATITYSGVVEITGGTFADILSLQITDLYSYTDSFGNSSSATVNDSPAITESPTEYLFTSVTKGGSYDGVEYGKVVNFIHTMTLPYFGHFPSGTNLNAYVDIKIQPYQNADSIADMNVSYNINSTFSTTKLEEGSRNFVATGEISAGQVVGLKSDGTVEVIQLETFPVPQIEAIGDETVIHNDHTFGISTCFDPTYNKVIVAYQDMSNQGILALGTVDGGSITFDWTGVFGAFGQNPSIMFDPNSNKAIVAWFDGDAMSPEPAIKASVITINENSLSVGTPTILTTDMIMEPVQMISDPISNRVIFGWKDDMNMKIKVVVGTVGSTMSFGTPAEFDFSMAPMPPEKLALAMDTNENKLVLYYFNGMEISRFHIGDINPSTDEITFGTGIDIPVAMHQSMTFDPVSNKILLVWVDAFSQTTGNVSVGTVTGNSISFGSDNVFWSGGNILDCRSIYDTSQNQIIIRFNTLSGSGSTSQFVTGTVSGDSITFTDPFIWKNQQGSFSKIVFDSNSNKVVTVDQMYDPSSRACAHVYTPPGTVTSTIPPEVIGSDVTYHDGDLRDNIKCIFDSNSNKVVMLYYPNGGDPKVIVGEISGDTITFGSPTTIFERVYYPSITFDSNSNKIVIVYVEYDNNHCRAIVGDVSGNSITLGTSVLITDAHYVDYVTGVTFDPNSNKVVAAWKNDDDYEGWAAVGTVSGNSITFGTPVIFEPAESRVNYLNAISMVADTNANKIVLVYHEDDSTTSYVRVGEISGDSITFGDYLDIGAKTEPVVIFEPNYNKILLSYRDQSMSYFGAIDIGTVSGNSITFGSPNIYYDQDGFGSPISTYDSIRKKITISFIVHGWHGAIDTTRFITGDVSEDSITFGSDTIWYENQVGRRDIVYDTNLGKIFLSYTRPGLQVDAVSNALVYTPEGEISTNANSWIGIAKEAISSGSSGPINLLGSTDANQTGLSNGNTYYVNYDGTLTDTPNEGANDGTYGKIGVAVSSNSLYLSK